MKAQPDTLSVTLYVHAQKRFDGSIAYSVFTHKFKATDGMGFPVAEYQFELPVPAISKFDLVQAEIDSLRAEQNKILADAEVKSGLLEDRIQALLCLEGKVISKDDEALPY
ncbi:hypothetical protein VRQ87_003672 [Morganella morganii]|uniref:hypothetical protein n=1 Tax=Morganella morganii TaxID=582 RepID=UPI001BDADAFA|nr:hypothetical protein [Morganella morganii]EMD6373746.1 hypothetical protein [Morganella morganii]MBT0384735.1 hypothetical protein [Morganella morganii subsp. morganii]